MQRPLVNLTAPLNRRHPLNRGLLARWIALPGLTGGSTLVDLCGRTHGTLVNGPEWRGATHAGGWGSLDYISASSQYVSLPGSRLTGTGNTFAWAAWVWLSSSASSPVLWGQSSTNNAWHVELRTSSNSIGIFEPGTNVAISSDNVYSDQEWFRLLYTRRGTGSGTHFFFVNGQPVGLATDGSANFSDTTAEKQIGQRGNSSQYMWGGLDDITLWGRPLSGAEAALDYELSRRFLPGVLRPRRRTQILVAATTTGLIQPAGIASAEGFGTPSLTQSVELAGIGTAEAFGSAAVNQTISPTGMASGAAFGTAAVGRQTVQGSGIASAEAIGAAALGHELSATGIAPAETVGSVAIAQAVSAAGISSAEALGDPVLSDADIRATGIASAEAFGTCQANQSVVCRPVGATVTGFSESEAAGTGDTLSWNHTCLGSDRLLVVAIPIRKAAGEPSAPTPDSVTYNGVAMSQQLLRGITDNRVAIYTLVNPPAGTHQVSYTLLSDAADLIGSAVSLASVDQSAAVASFDWQTGTDSNPATTITATNGLTWIIDCITVLGGLAKSTDAGLRTLDDALQDRSGAAVQRVESAGAQSISWQNTSGASSYVTVVIEVAPSVESTTGSGIGSGESFGTAAIAQTIIPAEVESGAAFGTAAVGRQTVQASGIASGESFGAAAAVQGIQPAGSGSAEAFGAITVDGGTPVLQPTGIATGAAVGTPAVTRRIAATGIPSGAAIGTATVSVRVAAGGVGSAESVGQPAVQQLAAATGIATGEAFGAPDLTQRTVATGIPSGAAIGSATVSMRVATTGVASAEGAGQPAVRLLTAATGIASAEAHGVASVSVRLLPSAIPSAEALGTAAVSTGRLLPAGIASGEAIGLPTVVAGQSVLIVGTLTIQPALSAAMTVDVALQGTINVRPAITAELEVTP